MHDEPEGSTIAVVGDLTVDWVLLVPEVVQPDQLEYRYHWEAPPAVRLTAAPGGAALLTAVLESACTTFGGDRPTRVAGMTIPPERLTDPTSGVYTRAYSCWRPYPAELGSGALVWRLHEFLGAQPGRLRDAPPPTRSDQAPTCLVIDDANQGFREQPEAWPAAIRSTTSPPAHIILKMTNPLGAGALWDALVSRHADRLTVYCSLGDLRKEFAPVGQPLSWERLATEVTDAVRARPDLRQAARVAVAVGLGGALLVERDGPSHLVFDPLNQEGDWEAYRPGTPVALGTCLTASLALEAARRAERPDWLGALRAGLAAARVAHTGRIVLPAPGDNDAGFPHEVVSRALTDPASGGEFRTVVTPTDRDWRIAATVGGDGYQAIAARIVVEGEREACRDLPIDRVGAWVSIDRAEIESLRAARAIMQEYVRHPRRGRPLSLAVFGPPGSGKSFAIKQLARDWLRAGVPLTVLEINVAQLSGPGDLPGALQQARDCAVGGSLPLVFWDEFDTAVGGQELGWLATFLAPMQDGTFVEHGISRPIGPAIFVFAGGTHPSMARFKDHAVQLPGAKATDFLSRLRGYIDILGPNPLDDGDRTFVLRRALLLRALLQQRAPGLSRGDCLDIDPGVLRAFLNVATYLHGARSMEAIVDMSALSGRLRYERSALPPPRQLALHVDADAFLRLVQLDPAVESA